MSLNRQIAKPLSRNDIKHIAAEIRSLLGLNDILYVDIMVLFELILPRIFSEDEFDYEVVPKEEFPDLYAITLGGKRILIREDVYERACAGSPRDRFTVAHEIGHFILHEKSDVGLARMDSDERIPAYMDPEWQANVFAGYLLMGENLIENMTVDEIVEKCGVSYAAAYIQKTKK